MHTHNWPGGIDRSGSNWTGRAQRTSDWGGNWADNSHTPPWGWIPTIGMALAVVLLLIAMLHVGAAVGF